MHFSCQRNLTDRLESVAVFSGHDMHVEMIDCAKETAMKLMKENKSGGFNLVNNNFKAAGQIVNHFHMHVIPRKDSDGFKLVG